MLGFRELVILIILVGVPALIGFVIWRASRRSTSSASRLAALESLRAAGKITAAEHERQRASIISGV